MEEEGKDTMLPLVGFRRCREKANEITADDFLYHTGFGERTMYFSTVDFATMIPSLPSSPTMRGEPHVGLA